MSFESSVGQIKAMNEVFDIVKKYESKIDPDSGNLLGGIVNLSGAAWFVVPVC